MSEEEVKAEYRKMSLLELAQMEQLMLAAARLGRGFVESAESDKVAMKMSAYAEGAEDTLKIIREVMKEKENERTE